ncbi:MAG: potassium channel family protein [Candidatus Gracilibacteria bacterium]|nr:potassium channel family protein [Candidatus Gracilibacteria bacterium]
MIKRKSNFSLKHYLKDNKKILNETSIVINIFFLFILLFEFFVPNNEILKYIQIFLGGFFILEILMRITIHNFSLKYILSAITLLDFVIIIAIFTRYYYIDHALLHFFTALKVLRSYRVIHELSQFNKFFDKNKDLIFSIINLVIFTFFMASLVFVWQVEQNDDINNFLDALYFTIATLTTTGFGDITPMGDNGRVLTIIIMTLGTGLFLRLVTVIFRPIKKHSPCKHCGLKRHDKDASHCKHCGNIIYIESNGETSE